MAIVDDAIERATPRTAAARRGAGGTATGRLRYTLAEFAKEVIPTALTRDRWYCAPTGAAAADAAGSIVRATGIRLGYQVLSRFIDSVGLAPDRRSRTGVVLYLRSDVETVGEMIGTSMRAGEVKAVLGINGRRIADLVGLRADPDGAGRRSAHAGQVVHAQGRRGSCGHRRKIAGTHGRVGDVRRPREEHGHSPQRLGAAGRVRGDRTRRSSRHGGRVPPFQVRPRVHDASGVEGPAGGVGGRGARADAEDRKVVGR